MQRKHIPRVYEYQPWTSSHLIDDRYQLSTRQSFGWRLISNINQVQFWLMFDEVWFFIQAKMTKSSQKSVKIVYVFWNLHTLKCKENTYLEYMNINHEPVATCLMIDIKYQPDRVLVDIWYQTSTRCSSGWRLISNINQIEFWLTFDIKHQPGTVLVDVWRSMIFIQAKMTKSSQKKCQNCIRFLESTCPEMQRKHIPWVYEYQSWTSSHPIDDWYQTSTRYISGWCLISNIN